jgi:hypothetical protein
MGQSNLTMAHQILDTVEKPETPLHEKRGLLDSISRIQHCLTPEERWRYEQMSSVVRSQLSPIFPRA